jgi:hypothetical protein
MEIDRRDLLGLFPGQDPDPDPYPVAPEGWMESDETRKAYYALQDAWDKRRNARLDAMTRLPPDQRKAALAEAYAAHVPIQEPIEISGSSDAEKLAYWTAKYARERETSPQGMFDLRQNPTPVERAQPWRGNKEIYRENIPFSTEAAFQNTVYADEYKAAGGERAVRSFFDAINDAGYPVPEGMLGRQQQAGQHQVAEAWHGNLSTAKADARRSWHNAERLRVLMSAAAMRQPGGPLKEELKGGDYDDPTMGMGPHFLGVPNPHKMQEILPMLQALAIIRR